MTMIINGAEVPSPEDPRVSLLDLLREQLGLTGTKKGCNQGACGACTVLVDGERIAVLPGAGGAVRRARDHDDRGTGGRRTALHALQAAFIEHDGFQCGYCTPGQICSAIGDGRRGRRAGCRAHVTEDLARETVALTRDEMRERMSGNLCRCGAHNGIVEAIMRTYAVADAGRGDVTPFTYARATDVAEAMRRRQRAGAQVSRAAAPTWST